MLKGQKSFRSIVIAATLIVATTITASASWLDYINPIAYLSSFTAVDSQTHDSAATDQPESQAPFLVGETAFQDFGVGSGSNTSATGSTVLIPAPTGSGVGSATTYARGGAVAPAAPIFIENTANPLGSTGSFLRAVASSTASVAKAAPYVSFTGSTEYYTSFKAMFGTSTGASTATSGSWTFYHGTGATFSDNNPVTNSQVFGALRFTYASGGTVALTYLNGSASFVSTSLTATSFAQGVPHTVELVGNNKASGTINYTYGGIARSVAVQRMDLYVDGILIGDDITVGGASTLAAGSSINSATFTGISSTGNVANLFADDIATFSTVPAAISTTKISTFPYSETFESGSGGYFPWVTTGTVNNWILGTPAKTQITGAHGGTKAWVTNLTTSYSSSHNVSITSPVFDLTGKPDPTLSFWSNFKSEVDWDAMVLEMSTNGGVTWTKVDSNLGTGGTFNTANSTYWYNNNSTNGSQVAPPKWSGTSTAYTGHASGWIQSTTVLTGAGGQGDVRVRWRFGTDSIGVDEGVAIDDIELTVPSGPGTVQFSATSYTNAEGSNVTITVNRTGGSSGAISVDYAASNSGGSVGGASCTAGVDYITPTPGTLSWADTDTAAKTFNVTLCNDTDSPETGEAVSLTLSNAVGTSITGTNPVPLNITDVPAMTYVSSTSTQVTGDVQLGGANQAIIGIQVVTSGSYLPLNVTQLDLSTNGSTAVSDIANAKVYYTGTTNTFSTGTQFGSTVTSPSGAFNVTGTQALVAGTNYFWVAYDIAPTATVDNFVDAEVSAITVGSVQTPTVTAPAGNRQIKAIVTIPTGNPSSGSQRMPLGSWFGFERSAAIYTAAELGLANGSTVQNACWYLTSSSSPVTAPTKIYMKTTSASTFPVATTVAAEESGATLVYDGTPSLTYTANTFQCVTLSTPFTYTGTNLQVIVETNATGGGNEGSGGKAYRYSTIASSHQTWAADTTAPTGTGTVSSNRPNFQFNFAPPIVAPGNLQMSTASYSGAEGSNVNATVVRVSGSSGTVGVSYTLTDGTAVGGAACDPGIDYINTGGTLSFGDTVTTQPIVVPTCTDALLEGTQAFTITLSSPTGGAGLGTPTSATGNITDIPPPFSGTVNVGTGELFTSLTNNGGLFQAMNAAGVAGQTFVQITSNLSGETGTHGLNDVTAGNNITIRPNGGPWSITGSNASSLIVINAADNVVIDGSGTDANAGAIVGGDDSLRKLTITNTNTAGTAAVVSIRSSGSNGATSNVIKNVRIVGDTPTTTLIGIEIAGATTGSVGSNNDNNRVENCTIRRAVYGISADGESSANPNSQNFFNRNDLSGTGTDRVYGVGIIVTNIDNLQIHENSIGGMNGSTSGLDSIGIGAGVFDVISSNVAQGGITNGTIRRNKVNGVQHTATYSAAGIAAACTSCEIANNMITGVIANATSGDLVAGIFVVSGTGTSTNVFHNSVSMTGDRGNTSSQYPSYGIAITNTDTPVALVNNVFYTTQVATGGPVAAKSYAIGMTATTFANLLAEGNAYWSTGAFDGGFRTGSLTSTPGTDYATLAAWQAAIGDDSIAQEVDPQFADPLNDLHLTNPTGNTLLNAGYNNQTPAVDFDNDPRPTTVPPQTNFPHADIGADEIVQADGGSIPGGTYYNAALATGETIGGNVTVNNRLYLNGVIDPGVNTLTMGCGASVVGGGPTSYINGAITKNYCDPENFTFPVGMGGFYSPANVDVTAVGVNPSSLTVRPHDALLVGFDPLETLSRNWQLDEVGDITANLLFYYDDSDVNGNESDYRMWRREGTGTDTNLCAGGPCVDTVNNILGPVNGVTVFSRWTGSKPLAPTSSAASVSGRVVTANGQGIRGAAIVITGNSLPTPIIVKTGSLGYFQADNLDTGQTYVVTIVSKRFTFSQPSRVINLTDSISDVDFIANPLE